MAIRKHTGFLLLALLGSAWLSQVWAQSPVSIRGRVTAEGSPLEGAYVGTHAAGKAFTTYVMTDSSGQFTFRELPAGSYAVFTRIPGFRTVQKDGIRVEAGREGETDFQVEPETDFLTLVEQATNSELTESFPLAETQRKALDYRCGECHGAYYLAKTRFTLKDWAIIIAKMDDHGSITPAGDISPPPRMSRPSARPPSTEYPGSDDESIARVLAQFRGPGSPDFPIQFQPRHHARRAAVDVDDHGVIAIGPKVAGVDQDRVHLGVVTDRDEPDSSLQVVPDRWRLGERCQRAEHGPVRGPDIK